MSNKSMDEKEEEVRNALPSADLNTNGATLNTRGATLNTRGATLNTTGATLGGSNKITWDTNVIKGNHRGTEPWNEATRPDKKKKEDPSCEFGSIISINGDSAIIGGVVYAGDKVWNVAPQPIFGSSGSFLVWLEIGVTVNSEDGFAFPGLKTSTAPIWRNGGLSGGYPDMNQPTGASPTGTAIVAIGSFTIDNGTISFTPTSCGDVKINYCPTNLSVERGGTGNGYYY
jgi:hypothetical protein